MISRWGEKGNVLIAMKNVMVKIAKTKIIYHEVGE